MRCSALGSAFPPLSAPAPPIYPPPLLCLRAFPIPFQAPLSFWPCHYMTLSAVAPLCLKMMPAAPGLLDCCKLSPQPPWPLPRAAPGMTWSFLLCPFPGIPMCTTHTPETTNDRLSFPWTLHQPQMEVLTLRTQKRGREDLEP